MDENLASSGRSYQIDVIRPKTRWSIWSRLVGLIRRDRTAEIRLELDDEKIEAIKACLSKGQLVISVSNVDFSQSGRFDDPYKYD